MRKFTRSARQAACDLGLPIQEASELIELEARACRIPCLLIGEKLFFETATVDKALAQLGSSDSIEQLATPSSEVETTNR